MDERGDETMRGFAMWVVMCSMLIVGCSRENFGPIDGQGSQGRLKVLMTDDPATFDAVNIVVTQVQVHKAGADSLSGWITLDSTTRTYDLLTLTNGASAVLGDGLLDAGKYTQIRLIIGEGSTVVVGGQTFQLKIPSGMQSGLKLNHQFEIHANTLYELMIDFNASRSIHKDGPGTYILTPVIRVEAVQSSGSISGTVSPASAHAAVSAIAGSDTSTTFADTTTGFFKIMPLLGGLSYNVVIVPDTTYRDTTLVGVGVVVLQNTDVGTIVLQPK
jgi:hypothetical protein